MTEYLTDGGYSENEISEFRGLLTGERTDWLIRDEPTLKLLKRDLKISAKSARAKGVWPPLKKGNTNYNRANKQAFLRFVHKHELIHINGHWVFPNRVTPYLDNLIANCKNNMIDLRKAPPFVIAEWVEKVAPYMKSRGFERKSKDDPKVLRRKQ